MITAKEARQYYEGSDAIHDFDHVLRVAALADRLAVAEGADREIVRTAALLHDVARGQESKNSDDHAQLGAELACRLLADQSAEKVAAVAHAITAHRFRTGPEPATLEAKVLHDADKLDAIGATGVARAFAYGGHKGQRLWAEVRPDYREDTATPEEHTPAHEYAIKLSRIRERLLTESARLIAEDRHAFMAAFFERLEREVQGLA